jgi:transcriptional regulator with XRE-family HTH domain
MSSILKQVISDKMKELNLSARDVEKKGELPRGSLWPLLKGESSNPTLKTLYSLSSALECSVSELLGIKPNPQQFKKTNTKFSPTLYEKCSIMALNEIAITHNNFSKDITFEQFLFLIEELYRFSLKKNLPEQSPDKEFLEFLIDKLLD